MITFDKLAGYFNTNVLTSQFSPTSVPTGHFAVFY